MRNLKYPENSIQAFVDQWWIIDNDKSYERGRLIQAYLPHIDQISYQLIATGRKEPTDHHCAHVKIEPLNIKKKPPKKSILPVAALPIYKNEIFLVNRAKKRPAIIISGWGHDIDKRLTLGKPKWQTAPNIIVAPYYGVDEGGERAGFSDEFISRVQSCEYSQFFWDKLPFERGTTESILKINNLQPVGFHHNNIEMTDYRLSKDAMEILLNSWLNWFIHGYLDKESVLAYFIKEMETINNI
jgi:hypothetical protein